MFSETKLVDLPAVLSQHGFEYRKGKTFEDIRKALQKGLRAGHARTELEISMVEVYLAGVLKKVRT